MILVFKKISKMTFNNIFLYVQISALISETFPLTADGNTRRNPQQYITWTGSKWGVFIKLLHFITHRILQKRRERDCESQEEWMISRVHRLLNQLRKVHMSSRKTVCLYV